MGDYGLATVFGDRDVAARIEGLEMAAIMGGVEAARRRSPSGFVLPLGGGAACFAGEGSPLNKVVGVGFGGVPNAEDWERVEVEYTEVGAPVVVELVHLADSRIGEELTGRGYRLSSFENVLGLRLGGRASSRIEVGREEGDGADGRPTHIEVQREEGAAFDTWLDVVVDGFASPDDDDPPAHEEFPRKAIAAVMRNMAAVGETRRYLAYRDGVPVGGASMRIDGGVAALAGAATLPRPSQARCPDRPSRGPTHRGGRCRLRPRGDHHPTRLEVPAEFPSPRLHRPLHPRPPHQDGQLNAPR
ncbi:GNAT family N-acetyltransferase [Nocardia mangyaensis]|nr:GNAT family N-acetyltransferase [Nocardia mangyaensis]MDO3651128.1 GNAT family N-acetyltransferase [Nocardia mangyaensis]